MKIRKLKVSESKLSEVVLQVSEAWVTKGKLSVDN